MHEDLKKFRIAECPTRSAIKDGFAPIVRVDEQEMAWLVPLYNATSVLKPFCSELTIHHVCKGVETLYYIRASGDNIIQIDCYDSCHIISQKKSREFPRFTIVVQQQQILGLVQLRYTVAGLPSEGADIKVICTGIFERVFPVMVYMSKYKSSACMSEGKKRINCRVRKKIIYTVKRPRGFLPEKFLFHEEIFQISKPGNRLTREELLNKGLLLEIKNNKNLEWLAEFSDRVQKALEKANPEEERIGFLKWENDLEGPHMQAVIVKTAKKEFIQIQVERLKKGIFQLSYYDEEVSECQMILIVSLENPMQLVYDIVYIRKEEGDITSRHLIFSKAIAVIFKACMVYSRIISWEDMQYGSPFTVIPINFFGKEI